MKNYVQPGNVIEHTAAAAITTGVPITIGALLAVPVKSAAIGEDVAVQIEGAFRLPKASATAFAQGAKLMWDVSGGHFSTALAATGDLVNCAVAIAPAAAADTHVIAKLTPGVASVTA